MTPRPPRRPTPPAHPAFDRLRTRLAPARGDPGIATPEERAAIGRFDKALPDLLKRIKGGRAERYYPYLLVRSQVGDRGGRPIPASQIWRSPDVWLYPGPPASGPDIPPEQLSIPALAGASPPFTVYAHVWNLGMASVLAAKVEFYTRPFSLSGGSPLTLLAVTIVDLAGRSAPARCHRLVKCPAPWDTLGSLLVRVSSFGDRLYSADSSDPALDRHVAQLDNVVLR